MAKDGRILNNEDKRYRNINKKASNINRKAASKQQKRIERTNTYCKAWSKPLGLPPNVPEQNDAVAASKPIRKRSRQEQRSYHNEYYINVRKRKIDNQGIEEKEDDDMLLRPQKKSKLSAIGRSSDELAYKRDVRCMQRREIYNTPR